MEKNKINYELKKIVDDYKQAFIDACNNSRKSYIANLLPGEKMPAEGVIIGKEYEASFDEVCQALRDKARAILGEAIASVKALMTEAPTEEAVNSISLLNMRKEATAEEVEDLLNRYGSNPQAWKTITSIAKERGIRTFGAHPIEEELAKESDLLRSLESAISLTSARNRGVGDGFISLVKAQIDDTFPAEE